MIVPRFDGRWPSLARTVAAVCRSPELSASASIFSHSGRASLAAGGVEAPVGTCFRCAYLRG